VPLAVVTAIAAGELVFQATRDTGFARWSTGAATGTGLINFNRERCAGLPAR
jgi:hypothetical protein